MSWLQIAGILRAILTFAGGYLVARGWITADMLPEVIAAVLTIGAVVWSLVTHSPSSTVASAAAIVNVPASEQAKVGIDTPVRPTPSAT